jgi:hypothetical protein
MRIARVALCAVLVLGLVGLAAAGRLAFAAPPPVPSLNGDNLTDLIIGVPNESVVRNSVDYPEAGAVNVLYSAAGGLNSANSQTLHQNLPTVVGNPEDGDHFGSAVASGNFNGDGSADVAIGNPDEGVGGTTEVANAGTVNILYGSVITGVVTAGNRDFHQNITGIEGNVETNDRFGASLAVGDFNADGFDDLAAGVPDEAAELTAGVGSVNVIYGTANGLSPYDTGGTVVTNQLWSQGEDGLQGTAEANSHFGASLAAGDFNGDGVDDLAVGVPGGTAGSVANAGGVHILLGSSVVGLTSSGNQIWNLESPDVAGAAAAGAGFGSSLAAADFNGDGLADLAVGIPLDASGGADGSGAVSILLGAAGGLTAAGSQFWYQGLNGVEGAPEQDDQFGYSLAAADFNWDGYADLAIGAPNDSAGGAAGGAVNVIHGGAAGLDAVTLPDQLWDQGDDTTGLEGAAGDGDGFGYSLAAGDFNNDGYADLAVGVPFEEVSAQQDAGAVNAIYGALGGLAAANNQLWHQDSDPGMDETAAPNEHFGASLAASGIEVKDVPPPPTEPPPGGDLELFLPLLHSNTTP